MAIPRFTDEQRRARLARRHLLHPAMRADSVERAVEAVVALHATDPTSVFLSAAARVDNASVGLVERAIYDDRTLIRHHAMRRTLWVLPKDVVPAAHTSSTLPIAEREWRRFINWLEDTEHIESATDWAGEATDLLLEFLEAHGPATTREIGEALPDLRAHITIAAGTRQETTAPAHSRLLLLLGFLGKIVRTRPSGSWVASNFAWETAEKWGMPDLEMDTEEGAAVMVHSLLQRFGPCTTEDMRWWTGWTLGNLRPALEKVEAQPIATDDDRVAFLLPGDLAEEPDMSPWVALTPGLDPSAMGWKNRDWYLADHIATRVFDRNGNAGPTVWADGRIVGGWAQRSDGSIAVELLEELDSERQALLDIEVERTREFVGDTRFRVRFPSPNQKELLA